MFPNRLLYAIPLLLMLSTANPLAYGQKPVDFQKQIRPILSDKCFHCHGPDENTREGELRLDTQDGATRIGKEGAAVSAGDAEKSLLWQRIVSQDPDIVMPPPHTGKSLTQTEKETIARWIREGATWSEHWAFSTPVRPALPEVQDRNWIRQPLDAFVRSKLEQEGLPPNPPADRITLARRLALDLTGLPPDVEVVERFVNDSSADATERYVEQLLASPAFGEKWGRSWLDAARYADSDGFEKDKPRFVSSYRDWVIRSFNQDLPYNQFIIEQIAGDLLPDATQDQHVATGFLRNSMINEEGGVDPEQFRMEAMFDRMDAIGKAILGLTISCTQCHDHKFDPMTQEEYYQLLAYLNNTNEGSISVYSQDQLSKRQAILENIAALEAEIRENSNQWQASMGEWLHRMHRNQPNWQTLSLQWEDNSLGGQKMLLQPDGSYLAQSYAPTKSEPWGKTTIEGVGYHSLRLELLTDPNLPQQGPGRSVSGSAALTELKVFVAPADKPDQKQQVKIVSATTDINPPEAPLGPSYDDRSGKPRVTGGIAMAIDGNEETAWTTDNRPGRRNQSRKGVFQFETPIGFPQGTIVWVHLRQMHGGWNSDDNQTHNLGRFRISLTQQPDATADPLPAELRSIVDMPTYAQGTSIDWQSDDIKKLFSYWKGLEPQFAAVNSQIEELWKQHPEPESQLALSDREMMRPTNLLQRGDFLKPAKLVSAAVPKFLHPATPSENNNRLALARWLADERSPTTARTYVNRVWQSLYGIGLVNTPEDFGSQGEIPIQRELLDFLAVDFMENGWSLKHLLRTIVLSSTYQQSSVYRQDHLARDAANRFLARGARTRVDGELVRDISLANSGLLSHLNSGKSAFPPAPKFLFEPPASYGPKVWNEDLGADRYRRSVYTFRFRSVPYPPLQVFDTPNGDASCIRRSMSNTPLQALTSLNETTFLETAQALARLALLKSQENDQQRIVWMFRRCLSRAPSASEIEVLEKLLQETRLQMKSTPDAAAALAGLENASLKPLPTLADPIELAAWTSVARVLLNLDETITKE